jgi:enoyl-CoA hydratase/carnithine racemase
VPAGKLRTSNVGMNAGGWITPACTPMLVLATPPERSPPMSKPAETPVTYKVEDQVAVVTMNRPEQMNRLDSALVQGLHEAWQRFMASDNERVAVLTGAGDKAFSAGADLRNPPSDLYRGIPGIGVPVDKPVVAAVAGHCVGGGMVLTTMCDLTIAAENAKFSYPEVKIGLTGGLIATLAARIPHKIAMELLLVGETIDAKRAYEVGYVNRIVPVAELMPAAMALAHKIAATAPMASRTLKRFVGETIPKGPTEIAGIARAQTEAISASEDWQEGKRAFAEKRPPRYKGR